MVSKYDRLLKAHIEELDKRYGHKRASRANIGWYSDNTSISTKVYPLKAGQKTKVLTSIIKHNIISHWEDDYKV